jgi:ribosome-associated heat shock protein Hsp15
MQDEKDDHGAVERTRIDKWLWCARFYKSRALATEAVAGGKVHLNGERVKPSHALAVGDTLAITRGAVQQEITVIALAQRRGPASEAQKCYAETSASVERGQRLREQHALAKAMTPRPDSRPDKRARRLLGRLRRRQI